MALAAIPRRLPRKAASPVVVKPATRKTMTAVRIVTVPRLATMGEVPASRAGIRSFHMAMAEKAKDTPLFSPVHPPKRRRRRKKTAISPNSQSSR
jgi:hypothetical protein